MANQNAEPVKSKKVAGRKKVNHYTKEICQSELSRLATTKSDICKYADDVRSRLAELKWIKKDMLS